MISLFEIVNIIKNNSSVPPIMRGTKAMIIQLAREERKIAELNRAANENKKYSIIRQKEDISEIFTKYVNKDFNKDAYLFIK